MEITQLVKQRKGALIVLSMAAFAILSVVVGAGWFVVGKMEQETHSLLTDQLQTVTQTVNDAVFHWAEHHQHMAYMWASDPRVVSLVKEQLEVPRNREALLASDAHNRLIEMLTPMIKREGYIGYFITSPELIRVCAYRPIMIGGELPEEMHGSMQKAQGGLVHISAPMSFGQHSPHWPSDVPKGIPSSFVLSPIVDEEGESIAVLTFHIPSTEDWTHITSLGRFGRSGETYIVDKSGALLSESRFLDELKTAGLLAADAATSIGLRLAELPSDASQSSDKPRPLIHSVEAVTNIDSGNSLIPYREYRGVKVVGAWGWNSELGIGVVSEIDEDEAYGVLRFAQWSHWAAIIGTASLLLWIIIFSHRRYLEASLLAEEEITLRERSEKLQRESEYLAMHDSLTGLPNRRFFDAMGRKILSRRGREKGSAGIFYVDVDFFKEINDTHGHEAGDEYLEVLSRRLESTVRESDLISRIGGDEFIMLFDHVADDQDLIAIASKIHESVKTPIRVNGEVDIHKGVSIGMALFPRDGEDLEMLVKRADDAMYRVKQSGRGGSQVYGE